MSRWLGQKLVRIFISVEIKVNSAEMIEAHDLGVPR